MISKEQLLRAIITEIDLIMHGKDYRFENKDGTWYSREQGKDLTNEELFLELKEELRELAQLEDKLVEEERLHNECKEEIENFTKSLDITIANERKNVCDEISRILYSQMMVRQKKLKFPDIQRILDVVEKERSHNECKGESK